MPDLARRRLAIATAALALPRLARARESLLAQLQILCGYPAGGAADSVCRALARHLEGKAAARVVVENRPGAAGRLVVDDLKRARPGTAMLVTPASVVTLYPHVYESLAYDPLRDLVPVSTVARTGFALAVGPAVPTAVATFAEFVRWCHEQPAPVACGNAGAGSMPHLTAVVLARDVGLRLSHVPYRSGALAMQAAAAGEVPVALGTEAAVLPLRQTGRLRPLATTWNLRSPVLPDVPGFPQLGWPQLERLEWFGAFLAAGAPRESVNAIGDAMRAWSGNADAAAALARSGLAVDASTSAELRASLVAEQVYWGPVVRVSGFRPES